MGVARVRVSTELLRDALHLPEGTTIRFVMMADRYDECELTVQHVGIPERVTLDGELPPLAVPKFKRNHRVEFLEWGLK
jgi:hypothetical protein